jgi:hypothetical protein
LCGISSRERCAMELVFNVEPQTTQSAVESQTKLPKLVQTS